jgi:hypothetical protein
MDILEHGKLDTCIYGAMDILEHGQPGNMDIYGAIDTLEHGQLGSWIYMGPWTS